MVGDLLVAFMRLASLNSIGVKFEGLTIDICNVATNQIEIW